MITIHPSTGLFSCLLDIFYIDYCSIGSGLDYLAVGMTVFRNVNINIYIV